MWLDFYEKQGNEKHRIKDGCHLRWKGTGEGRGRGASRI